VSVAGEHDLLYSDIEDDLRSSVRALLAARCPPTSRAAVFDGDRSAVVPLWSSLAVDLGLAGLLVPERFGGLGASAREAGVVLEELGRAAAPVPFLTSSVVATALLLRTPALDLLQSVAAGDSTAAVVVPWSTGFGLVDHAHHAVSVASDGTIAGTVTSVAGALEADLLLVPATDGEGSLAIYAIPVSAAVVTPVVSLDMTRQLADVEISAAQGRLILSAAERDLEGALDAGRALLASEQLGIAQWCLTTTVEYLKQRRQFGRALGGFQAIKHRLADVFAEVELAAAVARNAAAALADDDLDLGVAIVVAQSYLGDVAVHAAEEAVQLHGGIGMTWEHPLHVYLKRAKSDQIALGTPGDARARLAVLVDLEL
jgi:alkylation response protein AidB-like acyl-CoA dehydrogenase